MRWIVNISITIAVILSLNSAKGQLISFDKLDTARVFSSLESALLFPKEVYRLDLSRQKFKAFPEEIFLMSNLNELILDKNKLLEIPDRISSLKYLQRLSCSKNRLEVFGTGICQLKHLVILDLSENSLEEIPDAIENLASLQKLILWGNLLRYFPTSLGQLEKLEDFDLLHNDMNQDEQDRLKNLLPNTFIHFSPPCRCDFYDEDEEE
jgi:leucine-rich repeat protein SHOC2